MLRLTEDFTHVQELLSGISSFSRKRSKKRKLTQSQSDSPLLKQPVELLSLAEGYSHVHNTTKFGKGEN
jgi:hypothetical protein